MYTKGTTILEGLFTKGDRDRVGWVFGGGGGRLGGLRGRLMGEGGGGHCYFYFLRNLFVLVI